MTLSETVNRVIDLSARIRDYYEAELPKRHPNYPLINPDDEETPPPAEEKQLRDFLETLSHETLAWLQLLVDLGWNQRGVNGLADEFQQRKKTLTDPADAIAALLWEVPTLAYRLSLSRELLEEQRINPDKLPAKTVKVRKR